ncbi:MAG: bifunctional folylpolyglutamate synthase/dihydrofolate synthase [Paludibacteraceae bacterium]|nr:bifunctional folylpolyglutamate synthase/dihydrofolate synthase [Paludibacteraceae bacterium]MBR6686549.1 bifunctional folylpolyglutamate synthase/dihydrofolate synthase [Paludibacteraceae bacterium]
MNYQETLEYLFVKTPAFQQKGETAYKPGLANVMELDDFYGNPHKRFKTIHIAGTNGKGSVSHTLAAILQSAGYKVGLYTSPHLKDFSERIRINGKPISEQYVIDFVREAEEIIDRLNPSFFEITTLMAFTYFAHENVDIAVIETGLGGRLDSTNIISPILSVVTNVSFDHVNLLGDTLEKIAFEKAGIIKKGIPAVVGEMPLGLRPIFTEKTEKVVFAEDTANSDYEFELKGYCQEKNKKTILCAVELLKNELNIKEENIAEGLKNVVELTSLMGRWQKLSSSPLIIADTGHNVAGMQYIVSQIADIKAENKRLVIGMVGDKDITSMLKLLPKDAIYYFCNAQIPRALPAEELKRKASEFGLKGNAYSSVSDALDSAKHDASTNDFIFVGGSNFTVAEIITPNS